MHLTEIEIQFSLLCSRFCFSSLTFASSCALSWSCSSPFFLISITSCFLSWSCCSKSSPLVFNFFSSLTFSRSSTWYSLCSISPACTHQKLYTSVLEFHLQTEGPTPKLPTKLSATHYMSIDNLLLLPPYATKMSPKALCTVTQLLYFWFSLILFRLEILGLS